MQHWTVHEKVEFPKFPADMGGRGGQWVYSTTLATFDPKLRIEVNKFSYVGWGGQGGVYSTPFATFDPELRNERFTLMSFIGFPAILSTLQPFEICIFNRT